MYYNVDFDYRNSDRKVFMFVSLFTVLHLLFGKITTKKKLCPAVLS